MEPLLIGFIACAVILITGNIFKGVIELVVMVRANMAEESETDMNDKGRTKKIR